MKTKNMHDAGCSCLNHDGSKCDCAKGSWRKMRAKAKNNLKRSKVQYTLAPNDFPMRGNWLARKCRVA